MFNSENMRTQRCWGGYYFYDSVQTGKLMHRFTADRGTYFKCLFLHGWRLIKNHNLHALWYELLLLHSLWIRDFRSFLPGLQKRTDLLLSSLKSIFHMKIHFVFNLRSDSCHILVFVCCVLSSPASRCFYESNLKHCGDANLIFQLDFAPAHTTRGTKLVQWSWHYCISLVSWLKLQTKLFLKRRLDPKPNTAEINHSLYKKQSGLQQLHKLIFSMPHMQ